jgi:hypothetical protein
MESRWETAFRVTRNEMNDVGDANSGQKGAIARHALTADVDVIDDQIILVPCERGEIGRRAANKSGL